MFPKDVRYTQTHEWVRMEDGVATIGITKYAADQLSDLTYVELPDVGEDIVAEGLLGTIESVKAAADLICPVDGKVLEVNQAVLDNPEAVSADPYDDGWLVKLKPSDASQVDELMTSEAYQEFILAEAGEEEPDEEEEETEEEEEEEKKKPEVKGRSRVADDEEAVDEGDEDEEDDDLE
jgi:glycine cleavage system H protein